MPQYSLLAGHSSVLCLFCALRNLPDCARLEMLQTDFRREMGCSGSFASVRGLPQNGRRVISRVFLDDFGKNVRGRSLKCVRVWNRLPPSPFVAVRRSSPSSAGNCSGRSCLIQKAAEVRGRSQMCGLVPCSSCAQHLGSGFCRATEPSYQFFRAGGSSGMS